MNQKKSRQAARKRHEAESRTAIIIVLGGIVLIAGAVLLLSSLGASTPKAAIEVAGAPSLKADRERVDLGNVRLGEWVDVSFELTNVGDQPLRFVERPYVEVVEGC